MAIDLKLTLASGDTIEGHEIANHIKNFDSLQLLLNQKAVVHPINHDWVEGLQSFYEAERDNEEIEDEGGGHLPYDQFGELIRDLDADEQEYLDEDDYYYQITEVDWEPKRDSEFEAFVAKWMKENGEYLQDLTTHGCQNGTVSELVHHQQIWKKLEKHYLDIEIKVQEIYDSLGSMDFLFSRGYGSSGFTFSKIVWMCFEETVKEALQRLDLEDV